MTDQRQQEGREDCDGGRRLQEAADQQEADIDDQQRLPGMQIQRRRWSKPVTFGVSADLPGSNRPNCLAVNREPRSYYSAAMR